MKKKRILVAFLCMSMMLFGVMAGTASADTYSFDVGNPDAALASYTGPYATWTINQVSGTQATVTVSALVNGGHSYLLGDGNSVAANVNASSFAISNFTGWNSYWGDGPQGGNVYTVPIPTAVSTFGNFNLRMQIGDGYYWSVTSISFTLINNDGTWTNARNVLKGNDAGYIAADHIFFGLTETPVRGGDSQKYPNGYAAARVPEPMTLLLLGLGLVGIAGIRRRLVK